VNSGVSRRLIATAALAAGLGLVAVGCSAGQVTQTDTQVAAVDGASGNAGPIAVRNVMLAFPHDGNRYHEGEDVPMTFVIANTGENPDKLLSIKSEAAEGEAEVVGGKDIPARYALRAEYDASKAPTKTSAPSSSGHAPSSTGHAPSSTGHAPSDSHAPTTTGSPTSGAPKSTSAAPTSTTGSVPTSGSGAPSSTGRPSGSSSVSPTSSSAAQDQSLEVLQIRCTLKKINRDVVAAQTIKITFLFEKAGSVTLEVPMAPSEHKRVSEGNGGGH
jgi:copper(I)-binding protein